MKLLLLSLCIVGLNAPLFAAGPKGLIDGLIFHAPFDGSADADFSAGDGRIYTAPPSRESDEKQTRLEGGRSHHRHRQGPLRRRAPLPEEDQEYGLFLRRQKHGLPREKLERDDIDVAEHRPGGSQKGLLRSSADHRQEVRRRSALGRLHEG